MDKILQLKNKLYLDNTTNLKGYEYLSMCFNCIHNTEGKICSECNTKLVLCKIHRVFINQKFYSNFVIEIKDNNLILHYYKLNENYKKLQNILNQNFKLSVVIGLCRDPSKIDEGELIFEEEFIADNYRTGSWVLRNKGVINKLPLFISTKFSLPEKNRIVVGYCPLWLKNSTGLRICKYANNKWFFESINGIWLEIKDDITHYINLPVQKIVNNNKDDKPKSMLLFSNIPLN